LKVEVAQDRGQNDSKWRHFIAGAKYVRYEDLAIKYFNSNVVEIVYPGVEVRRCDITYGGGRSQSGFRFGNAVEFWVNGNNAVIEDNKIGQVFDSGVTVQAHDNKANMYNITFRNNIIWKCGMASYEIRFNEPTSNLKNIRYENNISIGAGHGWGRNGWYGFGVWYNSESPGEQFYINNNVFYESRPTNFRKSTSATDPVEMNHNYYYQSSGTMINYNNKAYTMSQFSGYQNDTGLDADSVSGDKNAVQAKARSMVSPEDVPLLDRLFSELN
jgi:hypothetical protein